MAAQLIPVFTGNKLSEQAQQCNARDLHAFLKVGRDFSTWITGRIDEYSFVEGADFWVFDSPVSGNQKGGFSPKRGKTSKGGRPTVDYHLTLDMAKELAMIENNDIGRQVRRYFIRIEDELRAELRDKARHILTLPGIKPLRDGITFKQTAILQKQSRELMKLILDEPSPPARLNLHRQLRQVNDALGIPTDPLDEITAAAPAISQRREG